MSISYGFYNSVNHDRVYDALDMSRIFDGIINDGVFMNIGTAFAVTKGEGMSVNVGIGRAWFDHTWTFNDAILPLEIDEAELALTRIDAVVLEVDSSDAVRANTIKVITGPVGATPSKPALVNTATVHQHALAYITIDPGDTEIKQANIATAVGTTETPFITGILETLSIDVLMLQWAGEFNEWFATKQSEFDEYEGDIQDAFDAWVDEKKAEIEEYQEEQADAFTTWSTNYKDNFDEWFENLQYVLDGDVAGNLQDQISGTTVEVWSGGSSFKPLNDKLMDSSGVCVTPEGKTLKEAIADGSIGGGGRTLTQAEYDALSDYEKAHGTYYIEDGANEDGYDSTHVWYKNGTVYGALNDLNSNLTDYDFSQTSMSPTNFKDMIQQILEKVFPNTVTLTGKFIWATSGSYVIYNGTQYTSSGADIVIPNVATFRYDNGAKWTVTATKNGHIDVTNANPTSVNLVANIPTQIQMCVGQADSIMTMELQL